MTEEQAIEYLKADIKYWQNTSVSTDHLEMAVDKIEKLAQIEQLIERTEGILELDNYTVQQIKEILKRE